MNVIECSHLTKIFGRGIQKIRALSDVSFSVKSGKIVGLLGPDGAGKTTLMRTLCGLMRPDSGSARVLGMDSVQSSKKIQNLIGYVPQKFGLYENLSVTENINLYAQLHGVTQSEIAERIPKLLQVTNLTKFTTRMAGKLSGGMKQKLALICALVSRPQLMLLDEPTVGVDVLARRELWTILRQIAEEESTSILVSTAYLDEADYCDQTLILFEGKLIAQAPPDAIRKKAETFTQKPTFENGFQVLLSGSVPQPLTRKKPVTEDAPIQIQVQNLTKKFGNFTAVDELSFNVRGGEIFGLLGANGAGKTTTFRMLCGLSGTDGGEIELAGRPLRQNLEFARSQIGYVAQKFSLYGDLTVLQNLRFFGGAYGLCREQLRKRIEWASEAFELKEFLHMNSAQLSVGFKRRLAMACALLHEPPIVFLDEATSGADPMARREFWKRILDLADSGVAVVITTHFLDEAQYCDRMIIMRDGLPLASGTVQEIIHQGGDAPTLEQAFVNLVTSREDETE